MGLFKNPIDNLPLTSLSLEILCPSRYDSSGRPVEAGLVRVPKRRPKTGLSRESQRENFCA